MATRSPVPDMCLVDDAEAEATRTARPRGRPQQRAKRVRATAAATDHLAPIRLGHHEVNHGLAALLAQATVAAASVINGEASVTISPSRRVMVPP